MGFGALFLEVQFGLESVDLGIETTQTHHLPHVRPIGQRSRVEGKTTDHRLQGLVLDKRRVQRSAGRGIGQLRLDGTKRLADALERLGDVLVRPHFQRHDPVDLGDGDDTRR